ncbi:MAG: hypothetical protein IJ802_03875 [Kiritimatiellae bacterium]|nr:hypothetical protein [Kiritimatiellia bacterium]
MKKWIVLPVLLAMGGCGLLWDDPYVTVTVTPLNWLEIHYYNTNYEPIRRTSVHIDGAGRVTVRTGASMLISDDFAKDSSHATWGDMREYNTVADKEHVRNLFQTLVNLGLFDREKNFRATETPPKGKFVAVRAAMDNKTFSEPTNIYETDPDLAEALLAVVEEFRVTRLGAKTMSKRK